MHSMIANHETYENAAWNYFHGTLEESEAPLIHLRNLLRQVAVTLLHCFVMFQLLERQYFRQLKWSYQILARYMLPDLTYWKNGIVGGIQHPLLIPTGFALLHTRVSILNYHYDPIRLQGVNLTLSMLGNLKWNLIPIFVSYSLLWLLTKHRDARFGQIWCS